jgi:aspartyl-tRNA(Asn)/glutamyl-tRNA(Gln) amidotransferase subunit A
MNGVTPHSGPGAGGPTDVVGLTAWQCRELLSSGQVSARELTRAYLDRIGAVDGEVKSFLLVDEQGAMESAAAVDSKPFSERLPWEGVPIGLKDIFAVRGMETTCGSKILKGYIPPYDATIIAKLRAAGLIFLGKLNMDEFAMGSSTENSAFKTTRNPWDLDRVPGGSSGGSAACVAASEAPWALGTDTGGSIRQPASLCGVVGLKPTYGAVSRYGLVAFASSLDQIGPLTRDVKDSAALLDLIAGRDPLDSTSLGLSEPVSVPSRSALEGLRFGVIKEFIGDAIEPGVSEVFDSAIDAISALGGVCEEVSLPSVERGIAAYYLIAPSEASANLARFDGVRYGHRAAGAEDLYEMYTRTRSEGFGPEVKRRIMIGTYALSAGYYDAYYAQAQRTRTLIIQDFARAFESFDFLVSPTSPTIAFKIGERVADPLAMYLSDLCTIPVNLAALPGISIPAGFSAGMPVGFQLIGPHFSEKGLLGAAHAVEQHMQVPTVPVLAEVTP